MGMGENPPKYAKNETKEKLPVWLTPPPSPVYETEAGCFPVSENTENKPNLP